MSTRFTDHVSSGPAFLKRNPNKRESTEGLLVDETAAGDNGQANSTWFKLEVSSAAESTFKDSSSCFFSSSELKTLSGELMNSSGRAMDMRLNFLEKQLSDYR
jgi:hypothetical protein